MKFYRITFLLLLATQLPTWANADTAVLVHGYLSNGSTWHHSGVSSVLQQADWRYGGNFSARGLIAAKTTSAGNNRFYTVDLPYSAPIKTQAEILIRMLDRVRARHQGENIILAGHSAGGIVSRMALVLAPQPDITALITIASPHSGTARAAEALNKTSDSKPIGFIKGLMAGDIYHTVRDSRQLLIDLLPPQSGNLLSWLNTRQHPEIHYASVIRNHGDRVMPAFSQDMNQVPALRGKSWLIPTLSRHELSQSDGHVLLAELQRAQNSLEKSAEGNAGGNSR